VLPNVETVKITDVQEDLFVYVVYLTTLSSSDSTASNYSIFNKELERIWDEAVVA
jgi:hypothetical protein